MLHISPNSAGYIMTTACKTRLMMTLLSSLKYEGNYILGEFLAESESGVGTRQGHDDGIVSPASAPQTISLTLKKIQTRKRDLKL